MDTKVKIVETAIRLFNQRGTKVVTTNHIAAESNISPGNLYYHFSNKEEIIRAIFEKMISFMDDAWTARTDQVPSFEVLEIMLRKVFRLQYDYRFFHYEMVSLLNHDEELKNMYVDIRRKRLLEIKDFLKGFSGTGILRSDLDDTILSDLVELTWFIGNFWMVQVELSGESFNDRHIKRGILLTCELFLPYMTSVGLKTFQEFKYRWSEEP